MMTKQAPHEVGGDHDGIEGVLEASVGVDRERRAVGEGCGPRVQEARGDQCSAGAYRLHEILLPGRSAADEWHAVIGNRPGRSDG